MTTGERRKDDYDETTELVDLCRRILVRAKRQPWSFHGPKGTAVKHVWISRDWIERAEEFLHRRTP